jgi:hypothetical protein
VKRASKTLRAKRLDTESLRKVAGAAGNRCGDGIHCGDCGMQWPLHYTVCEPSEEGCGADLENCM